jgi:predicted O-linked N-acetylglucosamine transferase (SPINDLY family)
MTDINNQIKKVIDLFEKKKINESLELVKNLINENPESAVLENIYGVILSSQFENEKAKECFEKSINKDQRFFNAHYNLGVLFLKRKNYQEAINCFNQTIKIKSDYVDAYINLSQVLIFLKKYKEAIDILKKCIEIDSNNFEALNNIGLSYKKLEEYDNSIKYLNKAIEINPNFFGAYNNLGLTYHSIKKIDQAVFFFNKAIKINPNFYEAYNNLALVNVDLEKFDAALQLCQLAIKLNPNFYQVYNTQALIFKKTKNFFAGYDSARKSAELESSNDQGLSLLGSLSFDTLNYETAIKSFDSIDLLKADSADISSYIFHSGYINNFSTKKYFKLVEAYKDSLPKLNIDDFKILNKNNNKIKIGFISGDFRRHAVSYQLLSFFKEISNRDNIQIFAYSNNEYEDEATIELKKYFFSWLNIKEKNDTDLIKSIRKDNLDFLIDLCGYSQTNRLSIFNYRSAQYQITWAGYLASSGMNQMDFIIADPHTIPLSEEKNYSEKILRLKNTWSILSSYEEDVEIAETPSLKNGYITFGSFNNLNKINYDVIKLWSKILKKIPNSKLLLKTSQLNDYKIREQIIKIFLQNSISEDKLILEKSEVRNLLFKSYNKIDIALDPFPYNGGTTSLEAAWMCVPILTKVGNSFLSRCGESININLGLKDWICLNDDDYVDKAVKFSKNFKELQNIKNSLKNNRQLCKLFLPKNFTDDFVLLLKDILNKKNFY